MKGMAKKVQIDHLILVGISILAIFLSLYPHLHYPFLLHVDEWFHVAFAKEIALSTNIDWYSGEEFRLGMERGWHLSLAVLYFLFKPTAAEWIYLPAIFHLFAVLSVYYFVSTLFGKKEALISALLIALIPSNVTLGGPVFLIPVNLSLIFIPLALLFAFGEGSKLRDYAGLFAITTFLLYAHPPTAVILLLILSIYFVLNLFSKDVLAREKAKFILLVMILSVLVSIPNYLFAVQKKGLEVAKFDFWVYLRAIPYIYGFITLAIFFIFKGKHG
jgi:4-amino-4-deoxy-L-arabinose transferase-like glycosyltransferase